MTKPWMDRARAEQSLSHNIFPPVKETRTHSVTAGSTQVTQSLQVNRPPTPEQLHQIKST